VSARLPSPAWLFSLAVLVALAGLLAARPARAQVSVGTGVSARKVEVGQSFQFQISAMGSADSAMVQDPRLAVPPGFQVLGPSVGPQTHLNMNTGQQTVGILATWTLVPQRAGTFRIGPASVGTGSGKRVKSGVETIEVVPKGTLPRQQRRFDPFDPFPGNPFGGMFPPSGPFGPRVEPEEPPPVPEEYRMEQAPDRTAFLRAVVTPKNPVVGEQVTLRIYAYGGAGRYALSNEVEPSRADFLAYTSPDAGMGEQAVRVPIGDVPYIAQKVREIALFPLRSGKLVIGPMSLTFNGPAYRASTPIVRQSERIVLDVEEPPLQGRPPGYKVGDVGELELAARVDPMRIVAGEGVSVVAKLSGTGNVPASLVVPQQNGVEWLEPSIVEDIDAKGATVNGFRVFTYVVKLNQPGHVDLGDITLPYFDPKRRGYAVARAALGKVVVDPNPAKALSAAPGASALSPTAANGSAKLPAARHQLSAYARPASPFTDGLGFWALLFGAPLAVALSGSGFVFGRRAIQRLNARRTDPDRLAMDALREADEAARTGRAIETAGAIERALFRAIEAGTGLKARALLRGELESALATAGVARATVEGTLSLLDACEALRFTEGTSEASPKALADEARAVANDLARKRRWPK
jgi:hypothetical protein